MRRTVSTLSPDRGIADPGAMKSWAPRCCSPTIKSLIFLTPPRSSCTRLPYLRFPPPQKTFSLLPSVPHLSPPRYQAAWMTLRALYVDARQEKLSSRCTTPHLIQGKIAVWNKYQAIAQPLHTHRQSSAESRAHVMETKTSRLPCSSKTWQGGLVVDCLITRRPRQWY